MTISALAAFANPAGRGLEKQRRLADPGLTSARSTTSRRPIHHPGPGLPLPSPAGAAEAHPPREISKPSTRAGFTLRTCDADSSTSGCWGHSPGRTPSISGPRNRNSHSDTSWTGNVRAGCDKERLDPKALGQICPHNYGQNVLRRQLTSTDPSGRISPRASAVGQIWVQARRSLPYGRRAARQSR